MNHEKKLLSLLGVLLAIMAAWMAIGTVAFMWPADQRPPSQVASVAAEHGG